MAFENAFRGIDFGMVGRANQARQNRLQQAIGQGIAAFDSQENRDIKRRQLEQKAIADEVSKASDYKQLAMDELNTMAMGGAPTPQGQAALQVMRQTTADQIYTDPVTQEMIRKPSPWKTAGNSFNQAVGAIPPSNIMNVPVDKAPIQQPQLQQSPWIQEEVIQDGESITPAISREDFEDIKVKGPLAGTPRAKSMEAQAGVDVQKELARENRQREDISKRPDAQLLAANFANRMKVSTDIMESLTPEAGEAKTGFIGGIAKTLTALPLGDTGTGLGEALVKLGATEEQQRYLNAAQNWVTANLRKESGAAIGVEEMAKDYAKYFPMPLDKPAVIADKARLRKEAEKGMVGQSAGAYKMMFKDKTAKNKPPRQQVIQELKRRRGM